MQGKDTQLELDVDLSLLLSFFIIVGEDECFYAIILFNANKDFA